MDQWAFERGVELHFTMPGKPTENAFVESFNGKFRDECLNEHCFVSSAEGLDVCPGTHIMTGTEHEGRSLRLYNSGDVRYETSKFC